MRQLDIEDYLRRISESQQDAKNTHKRRKTMLLFSIRDEAAEGFNKPFTEETYGLAERAFQTASQNVESQINRSPEDFTLWHIGEFIQETGELVPVTPKKLAHASKFLRGSDKKESRLEANA